MRTTYDVSADALAVEFDPDARGARSVHPAPGVTLDFDKEGRLIALELLRASWHMPRPALEHLASPKEYLTLAEAAAESGLATTTLRSQINKGRIAAVKRGRDWLVDATALLNYLESREARGRPANNPRPRRAPRLAAARERQAGRVR